jgi:hypothetical protein
MLEENVDSCKLTFENINLFVELTDLNHNKL